MDSGDRLGPYKILGLLGAGGMGEVYRARDPRLDRDVAIKVLPPDFAANPQRMARFEREAKLLAQLNHTNVATIHGLEEAEGSRFIAMECVEGATLAEKLEAEGRIEVGEALEIARQIAEALEAAHDSGVIHRDLKPGNVKVTPEGHVKVLDFGLAKAAAEAEIPDVDLSRSPTLIQGSALGVVLGTAPYMSPEQAKGQLLDRRTDVWSFGCVLYEMLTDRSAFARDDVSDTIAAILRDQVDLDDLPADTPVAIRRLLRRCLERDRRQRLRDMGDARLEIEDALSGEAPEDVASVPAGRPARGLFPWFAAVGTSLLTALVVWILTRPGPEPAVPPSRFLVSAPPEVQISDVALAPDGRSIAFTGTWEGRSQIYVRDLGQLDAIPLAGTGGGRGPFFSPNGEWIGFASGSSSTDNAALKRVSRTGGQALTICQCSHEGATWGPDDTIVLGSRAGLLVVPASGGAPRPLTAVPEGEQHRHPDFLPGGRAVLFYVWTGSLDSSHIDVCSLDTEERRRLVDGTSPHFAPSGHLVFAQGESLWAVPFDPDRLSLGGDPVRVIDRLETDAGGLAPIALSADGSLVYAPAVAARRTSLVLVERDGRETPIPAGLTDHDYPRMSPDGTRVTFGSFSEDGTRDIWIYSLDRSVLTRFTFDPESDTDPLWGPEGLRVLFHSHRDGIGGNLFWRSADGTGAVERLTSGPGERVATGWSPDGRSLIFWASGPESGYDLHLLEMDGDRRQRPLLQTPANESSGVVSPDGRWLAYESDETGRSEVYVRPFPDVDGGKWQVSFDGGHAPVWDPSGWSPDGGALVYRSGTRMQRVQVDTVSGFAAGVSETLFEGPYLQSGIDGRHYDLSPDGQRFVMLVEAATSGENGAPAAMIFVLNWADELERLAPTTR